MSTLTLSHRVSYESIRSLAIECHALDLSAFKLLVDGTHKPSRITKITYEELVTSKLLMLAISLRMKLYQGVSNVGTDMYVIDCGFLDETTNGKKIARSFGIKDICDKLIHADEVRRDLTDGMNGLSTTLLGINRGTPWTFHISMSLFTEAVLNWLDELPDV